jgi:hypothetical protein
LSIFDELNTEDNKLLKRLGDAEGKRQEVLCVYAERVGLYKTFADKTDDPIEKNIIEAKMMIIMSDMGLLSSQYEIQSEIAKLKSRLDALEKTSPNQKT